MNVRLFVALSIFACAFAPVAGLATPVGAGTQIEYGQMDVSHGNGTTSAIYYGFIIFVRALGIPGL